MKDKNDTTTIDAMARGRGRPKLYESNADRQRAYRDRQKDTSIDYYQITAETRSLIIYEMNEATSTENDYEKSMHRSKAVGAHALWHKLLLLGIASDDRHVHDDAVFKEMIWGKMTADQ